MGKKFSFKALCGALRREVGRMFNLMLGFGEPWCKGRSAYGLLSDFHVMTHSTFGKLSYFLLVFFPSRLWLAVTFIESELIPSLLVSF